MQISFSISPRLPALEFIFHVCTLDMYILHVNQWPLLLCPSALLQRYTMNTHTWPCQCALPLIKCEWVCVEKMPGDSLAVRKSCLL